MAYTRSTTKIIAPKLEAREIENIVDKIVPIIAAEKDHEFFRGVITIKLEDCKDCLEVSKFISSLLAETSNNR